MQYTTIELKIPVGSEEAVKNLASVAVERFLQTQFKEVPVEEKPEYREAVDSFRVENKMEAKFAVKVVEEVKEEIIEEKLGDTDTSINKIL